MRSHLVNISTQMNQSSQQTSNPLTIILLLFRLNLMLGLMESHNAIAILLAFFFSAATVDYTPLFNKCALDLHIALKKQGIFIDTSFCAPLPQTDCEVCGQDKIVTVEGEQFCDGCGLITRQETAASWADVTRVHLTPKYSYDRRVQFKDQVLQFQGKGKVDRDLVKILREKFFGQKMTKTQFLTELKQITKQRCHFDQVHCLYYRIFNCIAPNFSEVENKILNDFDRYSQAFASLVQQDKTKTFSNNQLLLFQLLKRHGIKVSRDDLMVTGIVVDAQMKKVFNALNWKVFK